MKKKREMRKLGFQTERLRELTAKLLPAVIGAMEPATNDSGNCSAGGNGASH